MSRASELRPIVRARSRAAGKLLAQIAGEQPRIHPGQISPLLVPNSVTLVELHNL